MSKQTKTTLAIIGGVVITAATISTIKLIKLVRDLNQIQLDLDLCDGDLCSICPEEKICMVSVDGKE